MFGSSTANKPGGLSINTSTPSLFGGGTTNTTPAATQPSSGTGLFGSGSATATANKPATSLFGTAGSTSTPATTQPASGGLFGSSSTPATTQPASGGLFGSSATPATTQPASGGLFGNTSTPTTTAPASSSAMGSLFDRVSFDGSAKPKDGAGNTGTPATTSSGTSGGLFASSATPATTTGTGLFGSAPNNTSTTPAASTSLFGGNTQNSTTGTTGSLFGGNATNNNTNQQNGQTRDLFAHITNKPGGFTGGLGSTTANNTGGTGTGSLFPNVNQQQQGPSLSTFGDKPLGSTTQQNTNNTVQGVKIDISNLVPTTKFDACSPELQSEIEKIDNMIQNQIKMCHEVSDLFPSITSQVTPIPTDVEFVENKLETLQEALEIDAAGIEAQRNTVENDAAEAKLAFRTIDTMLLPLQYQPTPGDRWWSATNNSQRPGHSLRSALGARHTLLALPKDAEEDPSEQNSTMPANLVEYVSRRAENMAQSVDWYKQRLTDIELHVRDLEVSLTHQLNDAVARSRGGKDVAAMGYDPASSQVAELAGALEDIEGAILTVAGRVGETKDQVNEMSLGPLGASMW